jgi:hypothetical protein
LLYERWPLVQYDAGADERFDVRLTERRTPGLPAARVLFAPVATLLRGPMGRVLNVELALRARTVWPDVSMDCTIVVHDDQLPENAAPLCLTLEGGCAEVRRAGNSEHALETDVRTFTQVYIGELTVDEAVRLGRATVRGNQKKLSLAFGVNRPFCLLDEF